MAPFWERALRALISEMLSKFPTIIAPHFTESLLRFWLKSWSLALSIGWSLDASRFKSFGTSFALKLNKFIFT